MPSVNSTTKSNANDATPATPEPPDSPPTPPAAGIVQYETAPQQTLTVPPPDQLQGKSPEQALREQDSTVTPITAVRSSHGHACLPVRQDADSGVWWYADVESLGYVPGDAVPTKPMLDADGNVAPYFIAVQAKDGEWKGASVENRPQSVDPATA